MESLLPAVCVLLSFAALIAAPLLFQYMTRDAFKMERR